MNYDLIQKLQYSCSGQNDAYHLPLSLKESLQLISNFFEQNTTNKLCLVFPSKEYAAQWLSIPTVLFLIENDFAKFRGEIFESYREYKRGDKLILNNLAIVEWVGAIKNGVVFKTRGGKDFSGAEITIKFSDVIMLQRAPATRTVLSSLNSVKRALPSKSSTPFENLLNINAFGNRGFIKNKVCLVNKHKNFSDSVDNLAINLTMLPDYFQPGKIDENGTVDINSPLLLSNNLTNLALYLIDNRITKIIIDGITVIQDRGTDFSDIDAKGIPTILITDLSEIESFEFIGHYGFEFFNFTKENLKFEPQSDNSPFHAFNKKIEKYAHFTLIKEICQNNELEAIAQLIHTIDDDNSNNDLNIIRIRLIQLLNLVSRLCHIPKSDEFTSLTQKLETIENLFSRNRIWLAESIRPIEESITLFRSVIEKFTSQKSEKCERLHILMRQYHYDYIICATDDEVQGLKSSLAKYSQTKVISISDVNDNMLLTSSPIKAIITGWAKSRHINRILSSFLFSELTLLFYQFENNYYQSLQRRNRKNNESIISTINTLGILSPTQSVRGFDDFYSDDIITKTDTTSSFDIFDFELKLDDIQYSKYKASGNAFDSIKAKRIDFENEFFLYSSESHKFLVINELFEKKGKKTSIRRKKLDAIKSGDIIALITTDRDILVELVEKNITKQKLELVKKWTDLWKNLLKDYFAANGNDFQKLVTDLRKNDCKKHEVTIRSWLQDVNKIGPKDDSDLISIALMTSSQELLDNISTVRSAISQMIGWRMNAADFISNQIMTKFHKIVDKLIIGAKLEVEGLGGVTIIKVDNVSTFWEEVDMRYANKLLEIENI